MLKKGFTVVELVITSAIFVILFAVSVANYREAEKSESLKVTGHQLTSDISWLQTASITGTSSDHGMGFAYGIYTDLNSNNYIMFRDDNNNKSFEQSSDRIIRRVYLPGDFIISEILLGKDAVSPITTIFLPPRPVVYSNGQPSQQIYIKISRATGAGKQIEITIDPVTGRARQNFVN